MTSRSLRNLYEAAPFEPFEIVLPNGSAIRVAQPELLSFSPDEKTIHVYEPDGRARYIDVRLVDALHSGRNGTAARKRKR